MEILKRLFGIKGVYWAGLLLLAFLFVVPFTLSKPLRAENERVVTVHYDGIEKTVITDAPTVADVLGRIGVELTEHDAVEPARGTKLVAPSYDINVYRARPVVVVDGAQQFTVMSPHTSGLKIAQQADLDVYPEDDFELTRIDNFLSEVGVGLRLTVHRSTPLKLALYGKISTVRTQAKTVGDLLKEKGITLAAKDGLSPKADTPITKGMTVAVYRNGSKTVTTEKEVAFPVQEIHDADREVGYREVRTPGTKGRKVVTYQIEMRNGKEVGRKEIQSVVTVRPKAQVEVVGIKPNFNGDFAAALAKLRSCEGSYTSINDDAPDPANWYYGAYQFNMNTWRGAAPAGYENTPPHRVLPSVQDQAARNLYERRGWQPWPSCGAGLPDIYR